MSETKEKTIPTAPDILSSLEEKADSPESESYDLQIVTPLINNIFYNLNHTEIEVDKKLQKPFEVITLKEDSQEFPRHLFYDRGENGSQKIYNVELEKLPVFNIKIKIGNSFNIIRDLPDLIKKVQEEHNSKMDEYHLTDPMMFIDTSTQLKDYWQFMAEKIDYFLKEIERESGKIQDTDTGENLGEQLLIPTLQSYQQTCELIASGFEKTEDSSKNPKQDIDNTPLFDMEWEKIEMKLKNLLTKLTREDQPEKKLKYYKKNPKKFLLRAINMIGAKTQSKILEKLNTQARDVFFHHAEAEMYRKVGLDKILDRLKLGHPDDNLTEVMFDGNFITMSSLFSISINEQFPKTEQELTDLKNKLKNNKDKLDETEPKDEKKILIEERTDLQEQLAKKLYTIIYSEKFFLYKSRNYSFKDAIEENQINCMVIGNILHQLWKKYCGEVTLGVISKGHFFSAIKLANGSLYSLDGIPKIISQENPLYYEIGKHEELYQAAILAWQAAPFKGKPFYKEAVRLSPNNPEFAKGLRIYQ